MTPAVMTADLVLDLQADLAEGPVWDVRTQRLQFVDITPGRIHDFDPRSGTLGTFEAGAMVGCIAPRRGGGLIAALADGVWAIDFPTGKKQALTAPADHDPRRCRFNDGKCDARGRLWAGTLALGGERDLGALYVFSSAHESRRVLAGVSVSNGLAWSLDGATLYFIDSPTRRVDAFDFDAESGEIANRRPVIEVPTGFPDGCTLDAEGMLWIAHWGGGCVTRWDPKTGRHLATVRVPAPHTTSCTFGGANGSTLYITTARRGLAAGQLAAFPKSGGIFACQPGVTGSPTFEFAG